MLLRRTINTAIGAGAAGAVIALANLGSHSESSLAASEYKVMLTGDGLTAHPQAQHLALLVLKDSIVRMVYF
jgi:hypothetical protein